MVHVEACADVKQSQDTLNRDLLVLNKNATLNPIQLRKRVEELMSILYHVESLAVYCSSIEVIDINRYKVIRKPYLIEQMLKDNKKPFVFYINKN